MHKSKSKIFLIEGPDCSGKSTLVDSLLKVDKSINYYKENLIYRDRLMPEYSGIDHYRREALNLSTQKNKSFVLDRFHIGEFVNPIIRKDGRNPLSFADLDHINTILSYNHTVILITCIASDAFNEKVFKERGEDVAKLEDFKYLKFLYSLAHNEIKLQNKFFYNPEDYIGRPSHFFDFNVGRWVY